MSETAWSYMVRCADGSLYAGWTNDLARRLHAHKTGRGARYTKMRGGGAVRLAYSERCADKRAALRREAALKRLTKPEKERLAAAWAAENAVCIRMAAPDDAAGVVALYNHYILEDTATFRLEPQTEADYRALIAETLPIAPFLVAVRPADGSVAGYASAHLWRGGMGGYAWDVETTIYCAPACMGQGVGRRLYAALLALLTAQGYHNAVAVLAYPNKESEAFHKAFGFVRFGLEPHCGYKFGRWLGVSYWQKNLQCDTDAAPEPLRSPLPQETVDEALRTANTPGQ